MKTRGQSLTVLLEKQRNFAVKNVIFLDIVMKHHLVQICLYIVHRFRKNRQKKNKNENYIYANHTKNIPKEVYRVGQRIEEEISKHGWREKAVMDQQDT